MQTFNFVWTGFKGGLSGCSDVIQCWNWQVLHRMILWISIHACETPLFSLEVGLMGMVVCKYQWEALPGVQSSLKSLLARRGIVQPLAELLLVHRDSHVTSDLLDSSTDKSAMFNYSKIVLKISGNAERSHLFLINSFSHLRLQRAV